MATTLIIVGLVIVVAGVIVFLFGKAEPEPVAQGVAGDTAEILEQLNKMLAQLDKRYRPGMFLVFTGMALIAGGLFLEIQDTKDAVESSGLLLAPGLWRLSRL